MANRALGAQTGLHAWIATVKRLLCRYWTPSPTVSPKVIEQGGVVRLAPGVVINGAGFIDAREFDQPWWLDRGGRC